MNTSLIKNPDSVYLLSSSTFQDRQPFVTHLLTALKQKKINYGFTDKTIKHTFICIVESRDTPSKCEEVAIIGYIDLEAWKSISDLRSYCNILLEYSKQCKRDEEMLLNKPRVHLIISSVKERIAAKKIEKWNIEKYDDFIADIIIRYHFDVTEFSSDNEAANYISEMAEAYSELRERRKADIKKKVLNVACKGIKGRNGRDNKLLISWMAGLACIPGLSENKARAVAREYPTMRSLMEKYVKEDTKEFGKKEKEGLLTGIKYSGRLDDGKKMGKKISKRIYHYFTSTDPEEVLN